MQNAEVGIQNSEVCCEFYPVCILHFEFCIHVVGFFSNLLDVMTMALSPPGPDEFAPSYGVYVARAAGMSAPVDELIAQRARLLNLLSPLSEEQAGFRYAADKWSIKELVGHITDTERIFSYRMLRIGRGDTTALPGFEQNDYVRAAMFNRRPFGELLDEWAAVRDATTALAAGMPDEAWTRRGTASNAAVTARALLYIILGHVEHHLNVLRERYAIASGGST